MAPRSPRPTPRSIRTRVALAVAVAVVVPLGLTAGPAAAQTVPDPTPFVSVSPSTGLDPAAATTTVTISGNGFLKADGDTQAAGLGVYVRYCVATVGRPGTTDCMGAPQHWVSATVPPSTGLLDQDGNFSVTLDVPSTFTTGGVTHDCAQVQCGISIRRDHNGGSTDLTYDSFSPITFATPTQSTTSTTSTTAPTASTTTTVPSEPGAGTLDWGVKASFRNYVLNGPAAGAIVVGPPATGNDDGTYRFAAGPVAYAGPDDVVAQFEGSVRFTGHHGALDLSLSEPRVEIDATGGTLVVDASTKDMDTGVVTELDDVAIADLDVDAAPPTAVGEVVTFAEVPATLTEEGAAAFGGFYVAGDALDPVTFAIQVDDPGELPPPTEQVAGCVPAEVSAGDQVTVCGEGFVPGEQVQVFLHSEPVFLGVAVADPEGNVSATVTIPSGTPAGRHRIELRGVTSGKSLFTVELTVTGLVLARTGRSSLPPAVVGGLLLVAGGLLVRRSRIVAARAG